MTVLPNTDPEDDPLSPEFAPWRITDAIACYLVGVESCRIRLLRGEVVRWPTGWPEPEEFWP